MAADLPVQPFNDIVGADMSLVMAGKIAVGQRFVNAVVYLLSGFFQFHRVRFLIVLSILTTSFTLERSVT